MHGSILIYGSTKTDRNNKIRDLFAGDLEYLRKNGNPDLLVVLPPEGKKSIGIAQIKEMIKFINQKPFSGLYKAVIIRQSNLLTTQAQNALLKTLEEPPSYAIIILSTQNKKSLLPTILSRCQLIHLDPYKDLKIKVEDENNISHVLSLDFGKRLSLAEEFSKLEQTEIIEILETWVLALRKSLNKTNAKNIYLINSVKESIKNTNVNTKLALDYLVLHLTTKQES